MGGGGGVGVGGAAVGASVGTSVGGTSVGGTAVGLGASVGGTAVGAGVVAGPQAASIMDASISKENKRYSERFILYFSSHEMNLCTQAYKFDNTAFPEIWQDSYVVTRLRVCYDMENIVLMSL
jgi:hypothetical protein